MSGLFAVTGPGGRDRLDVALARLAFLGGDAERAWHDEAAFLSVTRKDWELEPGFSGEVLVLESEDLLVAADAALYGRAELVTALASRGITPDGFTPSHLIQAAYRAWGSDLAERLVGDFAFVVWDRRERKLTASRDPVGMRVLYFASHGGRVALASSARALAELIDRPDDLNLAALGAQVAGFVWGNGTDTVYRGVDPLPPGHTLTWQQGRLRIGRFWHPPMAPSRTPRDITTAAHELRALLGTAVDERMGKGTTAVWMSGGWDSTAVFAAGQHALPPDERHRLRPVSISYPEGDPGREDELIREVAERWNATPHWIESDGIPLLDGLVERAAAADEPPAHLYELWNRSLAAGTRAIGARVALDGCGGDNLFQVSDVVMADHLRRGEIRRLARRARSRRGQGWKYLARAGILPLLPEALVRGGERIVGRRLPWHYMEMPPAPWLRPEFARSHDLRRRDLDVLNSVRAESHAQAENVLYVTAPAWSWAGAYMRSRLLQEGIEARSPLLDIRIVEFALSRPVSERSDGAETKILLRRAMEGLLPSAVLAPRTRRTGVTSGFSSRRMRESYPALLKQFFAEPLRIADLGIVDPGRLREGAERWAQGDESLRVKLFDAMRVEFWLRARELTLDGGRRPPTVPAASGYTLERSEEVVSHV